MADDTAVKITIAADLDGSVAASANAAKESLDQIGASGSAAAENAEVLGESMSDLRHILAGISDPLRGVYTGVGQLAEVFATGYGIDKIAEWVAGMSEMGAATLHLGAMLGESVPQVSELGFAAGALGLDTEQAGMGMARLERNMAESKDPTSQAAAAFKALGISATDAQGNLKPLSDVVEAISSRFAQTADGPDKTAIAMTLLGRAGMQMIPLLDQGTEGLRRMNIIAEQTGTVLTGQMAQGMEQTAIEGYTLGKAVEGVGISLYESLKPTIDVVITSLTGLVEWFNNAMKNSQDFHAILYTLAQTFNVIVGAVDTVVTGVQQFMAVLSTAGEVVEEWAASTGQAIWAALHGNMTAANQIARAGQAQMAETLRLGYKTMEADGGEWAQRMGKLFADTYESFYNPPEAKPAAKMPSLSFDPDAGEKAKEAAEQARKLADLQAQDAEQLAQKQIAAAESANNFELQMGDESLDQWKANATEEANAKLAAELAYLQKKAAADKGNVVEEQKDLDAIKAAHQENADALAAIDQQYAEKKRAIDQQELQEFISADNAKLADGIRALDAEYKEHQITAQQRYTLEQQLTEQIYAEELKRLDALLATLTQGTKAWQQAMDERQKLEQQLTKQSETNTNQLAEEESQKWTQLGNSIESSFNSSINGMLLQGKTFEQSMRTLLQGVLGAFLQLAEEMAETWLVTQAKNLLASMTTDTQQTQAAAAAAAAQTATVATQKGALVGLAGAGGVASMAAAPYPLDLTAPAFGASMAADAASYAALATGAYNVPRDMPAYIHAGEMVIPRTFAEDLRSNISGGGYQLSDIAGFFGFATGADNIPNNMVANIHKGEMIVPAGPAQALRARLGSHQLSDIVGGGMDGYELADRARTQSGYQLSDMARQSFDSRSMALDSSHFGGGNVTNNGGDTNVTTHYYPTIHSREPTTLARLLESERHVLHGEIKRMIRNGVNLR